ncbi:hypothetical protein O3P69_007863 [Scylla paramamosain]|uniref:Uncharacterized protein n=1 Tax=Scylla paramamosain TaxID=85552 RepID=A0AAW0SJZ3_SCYPA
MDFDTAIQLTCIEIKRVFKRMNGCAMDKKSNLEQPEKEVGLHEFLPAYVINTIKQKTLRKALQGNFKKFSAFFDYESHFKCLEILGKVGKFDIENFRCALGLSKLVLVYRSSGSSWAEMWQQVHQLRVYGHQRGYYLMQQLQQITAYEYYRSGASCIRDGELTLRRSVFSPGSPQKASSKTHLWLLALYSPLLTLHSSPML